MKKISKIFISLVLTMGLFYSCDKIHSAMGNDSRLSLNLNAKQKQHQMMNMRDHLDAVQKIMTLLAKEDYDKAAKIAYEKLGSTTKMKLMCASFGNKKFENMGLEFHKSADAMSEIFKNKNMEKSLDALAKTLNYCVKCHEMYRQ